MLKIKNLFLIFRAALEQQRDFFFATQEHFRIHGAIFVSRRKSVKVNEKLVLTLLAYFSTFAQRYTDEA